MAALLVQGSSTFADWMINEDYKQLDARGATDFEILLRGNVSGQITGGGFSSVTNPFANPTRSISTTQVPGNTVVRFAGSNSIPASNTADHHFGIFGTGKKPTVLAKAWSFATAPARVPVPKSNFDFIYDPSSATVQFITENTSADTVTFQEVGFLVSNMRRPIEDLNRATLPPEAFEPASVLNHEYRPGESDAVVIPDVPPSAFVIAYGTVVFSGPSAANDYNGTGGEWAQVAVADQVPGAIPTMSTWGLLVLGLLTLTCAKLVFARRRGEVAKRGMLARVTGVGPLALLYMLLAETTAHAGDVYILPLTAPAADKIPTIQLGGKAKIIIDTGAGTSSYMSAGAAAALGMDLTTGRPGAARGVGGRSEVTTGVTFPGGIGPDGPSTPVVPQGQASTTPSMPATTIVGPLPAAVNGVLGSDWLDGFNYSNVDGKFFALSSKAKGAQGLADATAIATFLGLSPTVPVRADGRPSGTKNHIIIPIPPREDGIDGGFKIPIDIASEATGNNVHNVPFLIKSGLPMTLVSQSVAESLGVDPRVLPRIQTNADFDTISVAQFEITLVVFDDPAFTFAIPVGVLTPEQNPFGDNLLAGDILGRFMYWEVSEDQQQTPRFYAALPPKPIPTISHWGLLAFTVLLLTAAKIYFGRRRIAQSA